MKCSNMQPYYVTFGSANHFPFTRDEYILIYADNEHNAAELFRKHYPDYTPNVYNFAYMYSKNEWKDVQKFYSGGPAEVLINSELYVISNSQGPLGYASSKENAETMCNFFRKKFFELAPDLNTDIHYTNKMLDQCYFKNLSAIVVNGKIIDISDQFKESELNADFEEIEFE